MNTTNEFDVAALIGRFQPFHHGHATLLKKALSLAPKTVVILGSSFHARSPKNPFTWQERAAMISATLTPEERERVSFIPIRDYYDQKRWSKAVDIEVQKLGSRVCLVGHFKDASSQYLHWFPLWKLIPMERLVKHVGLDATHLRNIYFQKSMWSSTEALLTSWVPGEVLDYLKGWTAFPYYETLQEEHRLLIEYKAQWGRGPFVTVDAVVNASGKVLLVKRGKSPGKGLWAVPGGFLNLDETVFQGAVREMSEETQMSIPMTSLETALKSVAVFDHPERDQRGRLITHAHHFDLQNINPPTVKGSDDAEEAKWESIEKLASMEEEFFEDHFHILDYFYKLT